MSDNLDRTPAAAYTPGMAPATAPPNPPTTLRQQPVPANTRRAYARDWADYTRWCRLRGVASLPPAPETVAAYLTELSRPCTPPAAPRPALARSTIVRRLAGLSWNAAQRGFSIDRKHPSLAAALAEIAHDCAPRETTHAPIRPDVLRAMVATLPYDLRGLRDRALLLVGYTGGLGRSDLVGLNLGAGSADSSGWVEIRATGLLLHLNGKAGPREVEIGRGRSEQTCPVHTLEQWLSFAKLPRGPVFTRTSRNGKRALPVRLSDKHVVRLIKQTAQAAALRGALPEADRNASFSGQSLRHGLARFLKDNQPQPLDAAPEPVNRTRAAGF